MIRVFGTLFLLFIVFVIVAADNGWDYRFFQWEKYLPLGDKMAHFLLLGGVSFVVNLLLNVKRIKIGDRVVLLGSLIVFILITIEEFSQQFIDRRNFDLLDLLANYLGIFIFGQLAAWLNEKYDILEKRII